MRWFRQYIFPILVRFEDYVACIYKYTFASIFSYAATLAKTWAGNPF